MNGEPHPIIDYAPPRARTPGWWMWPLAVVIWTMLVAVLTAFFVVEVIPLIWR